MIRMILPAIVSRMNVHIWRYSWKVALTVASVVTIAGGHVHVVVLLVLLPLARYLASLAVVAGDELVVVVVVVVVVLVDDVVVVVVFVFVFMLLFLLILLLMLVHVACLTRSWPNSRCEPVVAWIPLQSSPPHHKRQIL